MPDDRSATATELRELKFLEDAAAVVSGWTRRTRVEEDGSLSEIARQAFKTHSAICDLIALIDPD